MTLASVPRQGGGLELLLLLEEHSKADYGPIYQEATDDGHHHRLDRDEVGVCHDDG